MKWNTETRKIIDLKPAKYNPRKMSDYQRRELEKSLKEDGLAIPIVINTDNTVIGGHQRLVALKKDGEKEVTVSVPEKKLTPAREKKLNLRLNKISGEWDYSILSGDDFDIDILLDSGFEMPEMEDIYDSINETSEDDFDVKKTIEEIKKPKVKFGEMFQLGDHVLLHGDSTKEEDIKKALRGKKSRYDL